MRSAVFRLLPEHQALINSLLRRKELSTREVAIQTLSLSDKKTLKAWECTLYRYVKQRYHYLVVRNENLISDPFVCSDLMIAGLEASLISGVPNWNLINAVKAAKVVPASLIDKLEADINAKIEQSDKNPPGTLIRSSDRSYV